jgi:hypothetical protein
VTIKKKSLVNHACCASFGNQFLWRGGGFFFLSLCGFLGHLIALVLALFFVANISEMNICVEGSCPCLFFALIVAFSCCLTLKIQGEQIFVGLDLFGV